MPFYYDKAYNELWCSHSEDQLQRSQPISLSHPVIENYFVVDNTGDQTSPTGILPDLSPHIIIHLLKDGQIRIRLVGPRSKAFFINHQNRARTIILRFKPVALSLLTRIPLSELMDLSLDVNDVLPGILHQQKMVDILGAGDDKCLLTYLKKELIASEWPNKNLASQFLWVNDPASKRVSSIAEEMGISSRYLRKITNKKLGMSPKLACKIQRISFSMNLKTKDPSIHYSQLAVASGYYDQSHMIDVYQQFLSRTPMQLFG